MAETINDRMEMLINEKFDGNKAAFANAIGLGKTALSSYLGKQRRSKPNVDMVTKIVQVTGCDPMWLLTGEESSAPMMRPTADNEDTAETQWDSPSEQQNISILSLGEKIKGLMSKANIDAPLLAKKLGKSKQAIYDMLEKDDLNTSVLKQLANVFNVPVVFFLTDPKDAQNTEDVEALQREIVKLKDENARLKDMKLPSKDDKALDVSMKFFEAAREMFMYYNQIKQ